MTEGHFKKLKYGLISLVVIFTVVHLLWEHLNGGVVAHHLLARADMPSVSNWWGILVLPFLAWFTTNRIKKRIEFRQKDEATDNRLPKAILIGLFGMFLLSMMQSISFEFGYPNITMYIALGVLLMGLFLPIYRAECFLGHVLGATFTFGPIIPFIGISVMAIISALSNLVIKPLLIKVTGRKKVV